MEGTRLLKNRLHKIEESFAEIIKFCVLKEVNALSYLVLNRKKHKSENFEEFFLEILQMKLEYA